MFERFDDVDVPDQWDEISARAAGPSGPAFEPGGHRMAILVAAAAAVLGIAGVLWVGLGDSDDDLATVGTPADTIPETAPPATTAPPTTAPPTTIEVTQLPVTTAPVATVAETAPPETSAPPTTAPPETAFECTEIPGDPNARYDNDPALERFGPLGAAPVLDITTGWPERLNEGADVARVPGGTAIALQTHYDQQPGWSLTVVNDDGTIRWRRCDYETEVRSMTAAGQTIVVAEAVRQGPNVTWRTLNLATGADDGLLDVPSDAWILYSRQPTRFLAFGQLQPHNERSEPLPGAPDDVLRILDTATASMIQVPYPPEYYSGERHTDWIELAETTDAPNGWILKQFGEEYPLIASVFVDGAWTTDPAVIRSVVPIAAFAPMGGGWRGFDPLGEIVWTIPDRAPIQEEGPVWSEDGNVDMLGVCDRYDPLPDSGFMCASPGFLGVDGQTGTILWELAGNRQIVIAGDGYAVLTDGTATQTEATFDTGAWLMIDTATGEPVEGQLWPNHETFRVGYSMEEDGMWVSRRGGVVLAVNGDHIRVWFPAAVSTGTVSVSLPA